MRDSFYKINKEITRLKVEIKTAERELKKSQDKCEGFDSEVQDAENMKTSGRGLWRGGKA